MTDCGFRRPEIFKVASLAFAVIIRKSLFVMRRTDGEKFLGSDDEISPSVPRYQFADTLQEQENQLKKNPLTLRFARSRRRLANDRYRPVYHFVAPEGGSNDPTALSFWRGQWHLFYIANPPEDSARGYWGHAVSEDMVRWRDLPYAIYPQPGCSVGTGGAVVEENRLVVLYPEGAASMIGISSDPLLLNWHRSGPFATAMGDADIWKEDGKYFGLFYGAKQYKVVSSVLPLKLGGIFSNVMKGFYGHGVWPNPSVWISKDLRRWVRKGDLIPEPTPFTSRFDEAACPTFLPIGDKYILLFFSHKNGAQYFLGDYDPRNHKFKPYDHGRFNHGEVAPAGVHAPSAAPDGNNGIVAIFNLNKGKLQGGELHTEDPVPVDHMSRNQVMSLPQRLTLGDDKRLRMEPINSLRSLRGKAIRVDEVILPQNEELILGAISGNVLELDLEIHPRDARWIQVNVLRSAKGEERTTITLYNHEPRRLEWVGYDVPDEIVLDASRSSILSDAWSRPPEKAQFRRGGEPLRLRIFVDRSIVEVFVNGRQYLATRVYPGLADSLGVSLRAQGGAAFLKQLTAWRMTAIWPIAP